MGVVLEKRSVGGVGVQFSQAEVIAPSLHQHGAKLVLTMMLQKGNVLLNQLFLEVDGVGGNHHPLLVPHRPECCGKQVGERLAGAGACLDHRHPFLVEGLRQVERHSGLFGAVLVAGKGGRQHAVGCVETLDLGIGEAFHGLAGKGGDRLIDPLGRVVDDVEADTLVAEQRGDFDVGRRWGEMSRGVVVNHHVAEGGGDHDGGHRVAVAAGKGLYLDHDARLVGAP